MVAQSCQPSSPGDWGVDFNPTGRPQGPQLHAGLTIIRFLPYSLKKWHFSKSSMPLQCQIQCLTLYLSGVPTQGWSGPCLSGLCSSVSACFSLPSAFTSWVTSLRTDSFLSLTCISPNTRSVQQYLKKLVEMELAVYFGAKNLKYIHNFFFASIFFMTFWNSLACTDLAFFRIFNFSINFSKCCNIHPVLWYLSIVL